MADETLLVALLGGLHLLGFAFAALLLLPCLQDERLAPSARPGEDEEDGGGSDRLGPIVPCGPRPGGIPLPDATPARVRLRDGRRLATLLPGVDRRPAHRPAPTRTPARTGR
jgi:hypothetical protein